MSLFKQRLQSVIAGVMTMSLLLLPIGGVLAVEKAMKKKAQSKVMRPTPKKLNAPAKKPAPKKVEGVKIPKAPTKAAPKKVEEVKPSPIVEPSPLPVELPPAGY